MQTQGKRPRRMQRFLMSSAIQRAGLVGSLVGGLISGLVGSLTGSLILLWTPEALAGSTGLTQAELYDLQNIVELQPNGQSPRTAQLEDVLAPRDALQTGRRSLAELLFNEGSLARIGSNSSFRFIPGLRRHQLPDGSTRAETVLQLRSGVAMVVSPPSDTGDTGEAVGTAIETPGGLTLAFTFDDGMGGGIDGEITPTSGTFTGAHAAIVIYNPGLNQLQVLALTNGVQLFGPEGAAPVLLQGGQQITVTNGQFGPVQTFDLRHFYSTASLATGLGPNQEDLLTQEPERVQATLRAARLETLAAIARQEDSLQGLCTLDARGGDSARSANCITTGADNPLSVFQDQREDVTDPVNPEPPNPEPPNQQPPTPPSVPGIVSQPSPNGPSVVPTSGGPNGPN
jgi:hypothetical protein